MINFIATAAAIIIIITKNTVPRAMLELVDLLVINHPNNAKRCVLALAVA
jgi:hypothetical protein